MLPPTSFQVFGLLLFSLKGSSAFYLPGSAPRDYAVGDPVDVYVNSVTPGGAGIKQSLVNYDYYDPQFHFCEPAGGPKKQPESLGSILFGDRIFNSPYDVQLLERNSTCQTLCRQTVPPEDAKFINERITENYAFNWLVDGLPAAEMKIDSVSGDLFFDIGFDMGNGNETLHPTGPVINNHYDIVLRYHNRNGRHRIVGVLVWPSSKGGDQSRDGCGDDEHLPLMLSEMHSTVVRYSYRVSWNESATPWATRWDNYLHVFDPRIHWFSLINSLIIVSLLCAMVSMIVVRSVSRDISRYNAVDLNEDIQEDFGWKLVHGEVFRMPKAPMVLSVLVGNGSQLLVMVGVTLGFALLGFLSPSNRGALATVMMVLWTFFGSIGGYVSSRVYASLGGSNKRRNSFFTATLLPTVIFGIMFLLNLMLVLAGSSGAVPFGTMLFVVVLWFGISAPLSAIGSYFGQKHGAVSHPVRVNQIPRQIPPVPKYLRPWAATLIAGILPFAAAFVELYFILTSIFASRAYYAVGFLSLTACITIATTGTVSILFAYFFLCAEEYRWQWRSFFVGGGSSAWLFAYGTYFWASRLALDSFTSIILYFSYLLLLAGFNFLVCGTVGFLSSYWAIRRLYSSIRID